MNAMSFLAVLEAAALLILGVNQVDQPLPEDEIQSGKLNIIAGQVYAEPGETVSFPVYLAENPGYTTGLFRVIYDERLIVNLKPDGALEAKIGPAGDSLSTTFV